MKRTYCLILALAMLLLPSAWAEEAGWNTGDAVFFGHYEQDENADNGDEPIEWVVVDVQDGRALLVSRYALDCQQYHESKEDVTWAESGLRLWLNDIFLQNAFTETEQAAILRSTVPNDDESTNAEWDTIAGDDTEDRVFLLSYQELARYFASEGERKLTGTAYARSRGAKFLGLTSIGIGETDWWLRSPGKVQYDACFVDVRGKFGTKKASDKTGIRPAIWLDTTVSSASFPYSIFQQGCAAYDATAYGDAAVLFESLGTYAGSAAKATESRYLEGCDAQNAGDWAAAIALFDALGDYKDCYGRGRACRYAQAVAVQDSGDVAQAITLFTELGQYQDSMTRLMDCFSQEGISVYYLSGTAVNAGKDAGYAGAETIIASDLHFGWRLGRFFMTDFTRVTEDAECPIFIKTLGDNITLWFDLEQNVDALNGNAQLTIARDNNGYDQYFGVQKTDFGRGTLIIRHTNYQNDRSDPAIYTDYVLAKGTSGANTRVELFEEGDYEVALNYEVEDSEITHIINKYQNYRVFFRFSVRNGNCMVYPFDVVTGEELANTDVTENGFSLDLARSRYLDINVRRSVITEGIGGIAEDERFNHPAKDGDQYIQEGIYTITVSNRYTGETTTKTLFVGTDDLLQQYIAHGFAADGLVQ